MKRLEEIEEAKSVESKEFSETNLYYTSLDMNLKSSSTRTLYFEFDIRNAKDMNMNGDHSDDMNDLTLLNI